LRQMVPNMLEVWQQKQAEAGRGDAARSIVSTARTILSQP
jgi:hypothetical protein